MTRKFPPAQVETACQRLQEAHVFSYQDLKQELQPATGPSPERVHPAPMHENIRGKTYYH